MCGIAGIFDLKGNTPDQDLIRQMSQQLTHRGPDGDGFRTFACGALAHRRLAIIDPVGGIQPMSDPSGNFWLSYNGELYNHLQLRVELEQLGHRFHTRSDTETVLIAYLAWGPACVERFRGMFAFAIFDQAKQELFLARDALGIKPLYVARWGSTFAFASELKAISCLPHFPKSLNWQALDAYLALQYVPTPLTIYEHASKLAPAHTLTLDIQTGRQQQHRYWQLEFKPNHQLNEAEWLEALDQVIHDSVKQHLIADVPFGAFLSGGIDSSLVVAYMSKVLNKPVETFSIGFEESAYNELNYARRAAELYQTKHHEEIVKPDALQILPELVKHYGEPFADSSAVPTYYVSKLAASHVKMVLSGDGGDEGFAGYQSYINWMSYLTHRDLPPWQRRAYGWLERFMPLLKLHRQPSMQQWQKLMNYLLPKQRRQLWQPQFHTHVQQHMPNLEKHFADAGTCDPVSKAQYLDIHTYLVDDILTKVDRASMLHSLEVRTPLTDRDVLSFAATIPASLHLQANSHGLWRGKKMLKGLMEKHFPHDFVHRPKMGFSMPLPEWMKPGGVLRHELEGRLLGRDSSLLQTFQNNAIADLFKTGQTAKVWTLLVLDTWLKEEQIQL